MGASVHELDLGIVDTPIKFGDIQVSQFDLVGGGHGGRAGRRALDLLQQDPRRRLAARHCRRSAGGAVDRHPAADPVADRLGRRRLRLARGGPAVGIAPGRAVRAHPRRSQVAAGADHRRIYLDHRRDRRRTDRRRRRQPRGNLSRRLCSAAACRPGSPMRSRWSSCSSALPACSAKRPSKGSDP